MPRQRQTVKGRLYKRSADGREHPENSRVHGVYWLQYTVGSKRTRKKLTYPDGSPITDHDDAVEARKREMDPFSAKARVEQLGKVRRALEEAVGEHSQARARLVSPPPTLDEAWTVYRRSQRRPRSGPHTLADYERHLRLFLAWLRKSHPEVTAVDGVTGDMASEYAGTIDPDSGTAGYSPNTFNKRVAFLRLFFRTMVKEGRATTNPFAGIEPVPNAKARMAKHQALSVEQVYKILSEARGELALLIGLGYYTGLRRGDCCTLRWPEVDLTRRVIERIPNKIKNRRDTKVKIGIHPRLFDALAREPEGMRRSSGYVLPQFADWYENGRRDRVNRRIMDHFRACGIVPHRPGTGPDTDQRAVVAFGFHSLRFSYISHHSEHSTPQSVIQANAGHSNPAMTEHYTEISDDAARRYASNLPAVPIGGVQGGVVAVGRDPLPEWAHELVAGLTPGNCEAVKAKLLGGGL